MKAAVIGVGAVGARSARQLMSTGEIETLLLIDDEIVKAQEAEVSLGRPAAMKSISSLRLESRLQKLRDICDAVDVVIVTAPDDHVEMVEAALESRCHVVSTSDDVDVVRELLDLDKTARESNRSLVIGAGFSPGLSCLLIRHASRQFDVIDEIHVAKFGTGGPACAHQHHKALRSEGLDWRNKRWEKRRGGSGRELCWFPDPVGGLDCYQGALPESTLLLPAFPDVERVTARVAATRRDQATKWLPMLRQPHPEGMIGAIKAEVRGWKGSMRSTVILGALDRPAVAAGTVAAIAARLAYEDALSRKGAAGLAELVDDTVPVLTQLAERGVKAAVFEGSTSS